MTSLATELKDLIAKRIANASPTEMHIIVSSLCNESAPAAQQCGIEPQWEVFDDVWAFDRASGLYMTRDYVPGGKRNWKDSMAAAAEFGTNGRKCRAPTIREQLRMVDYTQRDPAFNKAIFRGDSSWVWTSTELMDTDASPSDFACFVDCYDGYSFYYDQLNGGFVRAVCVSQ